MVELVSRVSVKELCHCFPAEGKHATIIINRTFLFLWNWGTIGTINYILNNMMLLLYPVELYRLLGASSYSILIILFINKQINPNL